MKYLTITGLVLALAAGGVAAQETPPADSTLAPASPPTSVQQPAPAPQPTPTQQPAPMPQPAPASQATPPPQKSFKEKIYYGGSITLAFGGATQIGFFPLIAYKLTPKLSLGAEVGYEYVNYDDIDESSHNYGGSVFGRYRLVPQLYGHAEFQVVNYEVFNVLDSSRETVPFLLLGGGYVRQLSQRTSAYAEVLVDVLQDDNSPYDDWEPIFTVGVGVGF